MEAENNFTFIQMVRVLRRRALTVLVVFILVPVAVFLISRNETKAYTATTSVLFTSSTAAEQLVGIQPSDSTDPSVVQATNAQLLQLGDLPSATATAVGAGLTEDAVRAAISVDPSQTTNIVQVSATSSSPALAVKIANTYSRIFASEQQSNSRASYETALKVTARQLAALGRAQLQSATGLSLQSREQSLALLVSVNAPPVQIAQAASLPTAPSSPRTLRNTLLGALVGLFLGLALGFGRERLDRVVKEPDELAEIYGLPVLGLVPQSRALASRSKGERGVLPGHEAETFDLINAHLRYFNVDRELHTIVIASAIPGTGKTTVACYLAGAAARLGGRILLLESDTRRPAIAQRLGLDGSVGLTDVLLGDAKLEEAVKVVVVSPQSDRRGHEARTCDVLMAGLVEPPNPAELIGSKAMETLMATVRGSYDMVIVDSPPLTAVADVYPLLERADGVVVVGRVSHDRRDVAQRSAEILRRTNATLLGIVINGVRRSFAQPYGYYGYSGGSEATVRLGAPPIQDDQSAVQT